MSPSGNESHASEQVGENTSKEQVGENTSKQSSKTSGIPVYLLSGFRNQGMAILAAMTCKERSARPLAPQMPTRAWRSSGDFLRYCCLRLAVCLCLSVSDTSSEEGVSPTQGAKN
jgi:hypothetical protein